MSDEPTRRTEAQACYICGSTPIHDTATRTLCSALHSWEAAPTNAPTRRTILKRVFVAPAILTLAAQPSYASAGSSAHPHQDQGHHYGQLKND